MPWYRTGTVAVTLNSTTVTGTGTNFAQNSRVGDAFQGPDGKWYEITNIASATVLSILPAYTSATATGGVYALAPMQGYVKESADQLRAITNQYGTTLGLLGTPTDTAGLRSNIGAAKSGANNDITSITGLTTGLSVAQGGTGATSTSGARTNLGVAAIGEYGVGSANYPAAGVRLDSLDRASFISATDANPPDWISNGGGGSYPMGISLARSTQVGGQLVVSYGARGPNGAGVFWRNNVGGTWNSWDKLIGKGDLLGTVSQTAGVPTGAVIERGSNTAGDYIKFADGTMICTVVGRPVTYSNASNLMTTWTYPVAFVLAPVVSVNLVSSTLPTQKAITAVTAYSRSAVSANCSVLSIGAFVAADATTANIDAVAIGRWF
jgi:hypothetical protein